LPRQAGLQDLLQIPHVAMFLQALPETRTQLGHVSPMGSVECADVAQALKLESIVVVKGEFIL